MNTSRWVIVLGPSVECLQASDGPTENEGMDVMCALVGVHSLEVHHMTNHMILIRDTIA